MNFRRPSFKRGGSTGIDQLTPRKKFKFGTPGFQFLEPGLQNELRDAYRPTRNIGTKTITRQNIPTGGLRKGNIGARLLSQLRKAAIPSASTTGLMALPFVPSAAIAYANAPKTLEEKRVMQEYGPIDETFFQYDEYDADRKKARGVGEEISFTDALFMDPETGKYPKAFGRTEDREKIEELFGTEAGFLPESGPKEVNIEEIVDTMVSNKKTGTKDDDTPKAPSFEDTYEAEKKKIERLIGEDDNKGIVAIALSDAIGTPGTIADKAAVLNKALLGIMVGKKKDKKDIAKLAYTATKQIQTAKIAANKEGFSEKQFNKLSRLQRIVSDKTGSYSDAEKSAAQAEINITKEIINTIGGKKDKGLSAVDSKLLTNLDTLATKLSRIKDKDSDSYKKAYNQYLRARQVVLKNPDLADIVALADAQVTGALQMEDGGRVKKQLGGGTETAAMEVSETVGQGETPTAQVQQLSFDQLRNRLPKEITDDVIRLLSNSNEALQDFAYIRTQGDVSKFNTKYGVTLVLPAQT